MSRRYVNDFDLVAVYVSTSEWPLTMRQIRAIETPEDTGFRDLLGRWIFVDDDGRRIGDDLLSDMARRNLPELARIVADVHRAKKTKRGREWLADKAARLAMTIEHGNNNVTGAIKLSGTINGDDGLAIAKAARRIACELCPEMYDGMIHPKEAT